MLRLLGILRHVCMYIHSIANNPSYSNFIQTLLNQLHERSYRALCTRTTNLSSKIPIIQSTTLHSNPTSPVLFNREKNINLAFKTIEHKEFRYGYHPKLIPLTRNCLEVRGRRRQHRGEAGRGAWVTRNPSDPHWPPCVSRNAFKPRGLKDFCSYNQGVKVVICVWTVKSSRLHLSIPFTAGFCKDLNITFYIETSLLSRWHKNSIGLCKCP